MNNLPSIRIFVTIILSFAFVLTGSHAGEVCPPNFPKLERHTEKDHGDVCRNEKFHGFNVGWKCPYGCFSVAPQIKEEPIAPYCVDPWLQSPCRIDKKMELTKCLRNLNEQVPEICQRENGDEEKCQKWIKENTDTFQNLLAPCLKQLNGGEQKIQRMPGKKGILPRDRCTDCLWCGMLVLWPLVWPCLAACEADYC